MEGPAFSTRAKFQLYRQLGCSVESDDNHSNRRGPEAESGPTATLAMVPTTTAARRNTPPVDVDLVLDNLRANRRVGTQQIVAMAADGLLSKAVEAAAHGPLAQCPAMTPKSMCQATPVGARPCSQPLTGGPFNGNGHKLIQGIAQGSSDRRLSGVKGGACQLEGRASLPPPVTRALRRHRPIRPWRISRAVLTDPPGRSQ